MQRRTFIKLVAAGSLVVSFPLNRSRAATNINKK